MTTEPKRKPREWWLVTSQSMRDGVPETAEAYVFSKEAEAREFVGPCEWEVLLVVEVLEKTDGKD